MLFRSLPIWIALFTINAFGAELIVLNLNRTWMFTHSVNEDTPEIKKLVAAIKRASANPTDAESKAAIRAAREAIKKMEPRKIFDKVMDKGEATSEERIRGPVWNKLAMDARERIQNFYSAKNIDVEVEQLDRESEISAGIEVSGKDRNKYYIYSSHVECGTCTCSSSRKNRASSSRRLQCFNCMPSLSPISAIRGK